MTLVFLAGCTHSRTVSTFVPVSSGTTNISQPADTSSTVTVGNNGAVQVSVAGAPTNRQLNTISDIATYRVTLSGGSLTTPQVKQCAAPPNSDGKVSVLFSPLDPGTYTMTVDVLDASGNVIGTGTQTGTVTAGQCTYIDINIVLSPVVVDNPQGSLGARITVTDGGTVTRPIGPCPSTDGFTPLDSASNCAAPSPTPSPQ